MIYNQRKPFKLYGAICRMGNSPEFYFVWNFPNRFCAVQIAISRESVFPSRMGSFLISFYTCIWIPFCRQ